MPLKKSITKKEKKDDLELELKEVKEVVIKKSPKKDKKGENDEM